MDLKDIEKMPVCDIDIDNIDSISGGGMEKHSQEQHEISNNETTGENFIPKLASDGDQIEFPPTPPLPESDFTITWNKFDGHVEKNKVRGDYHIRIEATRGAVNLSGLVWIEKTKNEDEWKIHPIMGCAGAELKIPLHKVYKNGRFTSLSDGLRIFEELKGIMLDESIKGASATSS